MLLSHSEPKTMKEALKDADLSAAMQQEYDALIKQHTSNLVPLLFNRQPIGCKWVFQVKEWLY